jgi:ribosomal RNA-processing protein 8
MSLFEVEGWAVPTSIAVQSKKKGKKNNDAKKVDQDSTTADKSKGIGKKGKKVKSTEIQDLFEQHIEGKVKPALVESKESPVVAPAAAESTEPKKAKKNKKNKKRKHDDQDDMPNKTAGAPASTDEKPAKQAKTADTFATVGISTKTKLTPLQQKMMEKLAGSRFRWINEQLYTTTSEEAVRIMKEQPEMFDEYHQGFRSQVQSWPQNPVDTFAEQIKERLQKPIGAPGGMPGDKDGRIVVADMGCGEANLALQIKAIEKKVSLPKKGKAARFFKKPKFEVHSFDLKKANERITVADIKNVPLPDESAHVVVFCLALMGTNFLDFVREGLRILKPNGEIWIAEIKSRFVDNDTVNFVKVLKSLGLFHKNTDDSNKMFIRMEFFKPNKEYIENRDEKQRNRKRFIDEPEELPKVLLKPCIYKRR